MQSIGVASGMTTGGCKIVKEFIICLLHENGSMMFLSKGGGEIYSIKTTVISLLLLAWSHHLKVLPHPQSESPPNLNISMTWPCGCRGNNHIQTMVTSHLHLAALNMDSVSPHHVGFFPILHLLKTPSKLETHSKHYCSLLLNCNVVFTLYSHLL